jgi:hypothetical protein
MSPRRKHAGGRPRSAQSSLHLVERWGISERAAKRLAAREWNDDAMAILVYGIKRAAAAQRREAPGQGRHTGGMRALGMRSRTPAAHA